MEAMGDQQKAAAIPECRRLPKKEYDLYKSIGRFYEIKQYKKVGGLGACLAERSGRLSIAHSRMVAAPARPCS